MKTIYKQTPTSRIPKDWEVVNLGDEKYFKVIMGQSPPSYTYNRDKKGLPFLQGKIEFGEIYPSPIIYCSKPIKISEENDVLISVRAPVGEVNISPSRICIGRGLSAVRCNVEKANYLFLFYSVRHKAKKMEAISSGSTFKAVRKNDIDNFQIPLPPLTEQQKIAEVLSTVDEAIQKVDEAIAKTERLKKGLMQELLTKGFGHKEFKNTEIGRIPKKWEIIKTEDIFSLEYGKGLTKKERESGEFPVFGSNGIVGYHSEHLIKGPGIVVGRKGTIGATTWTDENFWPIDTTYYIELKNNEVDMKWLFYKLISLKLNKLNMATGTPGLNRNLVYSLKATLPPLPEQQEIAEILSDVDGKLELERKRKEKLERVKKGLMNNLLTGKKRVKV